MTFSFQPTCLISPASRLLLFVWSPGCDELDPSQHVILLDCSTHGHFFPACYIFLSDTHSQYEHTRPVTRGGGGGRGVRPNPPFREPPFQKYEPPPRSNCPTPYLASDSKHARFWCSSSDCAHRTDLLGPLLTTLRTPSTLHLIHQLRQIA